MQARIRKIASFVEVTAREMDRPVTPPARKVAVAAVIANPFAGRYVQDLAELIAIGAELGGLLAAEALAALRVVPGDIQSYGKAALVGEGGELEHAAALLHPAMGAPLRAAIGGGAALVPSSKKLGGIGQVLDIPLGHKDAAYVRSHFDGMEIRLNDAPRAGEILVAIALATGGRPLARVGGLTHDQAEGRNGLR